MKHRNLQIMNTIINHAYDRYCGDKTGTNNKGPWTIVECVHCLKIVAKLFGEHQIVDKHLEFLEKKIKYQNDLNNMING